MVGTELKEDTGEWPKQHFEFMSERSGFDAKQFRRLMWMKTEMQAHGKGFATAVQLRSAMAQLETPQGLLWNCHPVPMRQAGERVQ